MFKKKTIAIMASFVFAFCSILSLGFVLARELSIPGNSIVYALGNDGDGDGSQANPWLIGSQATLRQRLTSSTGVQNRHFRMINNIYLVGEWTPIPLFPAGWVFDGGEFIIDGLTVAATTSGSTRGLWANFNGTIRNTRFANVNVQGSAGSGQSGTVAGTISGNIPGANVLIENVRVLNGGVGDVASPGWSGGLVGNVQATATAANRLNVTVRNSSVEETLVRGQLSSSGLVGYIMGGTTMHMNLLIEGSFFNGTVHNASFGASGVIGNAGDMASNNRIEIRNTFAIGQLMSASTGGLIGRAPSNLLSINIINSFAIAYSATLTGAATNHGGVIGEVGFAPAPNIQILNSHFSSTRTSAGIQGSHLLIPSGNIINSGPLTSQFMRSQAFIDQLNANSSPGMFVPGPGGYPIHAHFINTIFITFNTNGGAFSTGATTYQRSIAQGSPVTGVPTPSWIGHEFTGWSLTPTGSVLSAVPTDTSRTVYARWTPNIYTFVPYNSLGLELFEFVNPQTTMTIFQQGYLQVTLAAGEFARLYVRDTANNWVSLGEGVRYSATQYRLQLDDLIDEDFITRFAQTNNRIYFRANVEANVPIRISFESPNGSWGNLGVGGINQNWGWSTTFAHNHTEPFGFQVTPNEFRAISSVQWTTDNATWTSITYPFAVTPINNMRIRVVFESLTFNVQFVANYGNLVPASAIIGTSPAVGIGDNITDVFVQSMGNFRLVDESYSNLRIYNRISGWQPFHARNGIVNIPVTAEFLRNHLNDSDEIVVQVVFVEQASVRAVPLGVNADNGEIFMEVRLPDGSTPIQANPLFTTFFDIGSQIIITISPIPGARVSVLSGTMPSDQINVSRTEIRFTLTANRLLFIEFDRELFEFSAFALDKTGENLDQWVTLNTSVPQDIHEDSSIGLSFVLSPEYATAFDFQGWYVQIGGSLRFLSNFETIAAMPVQDITSLSGFMGTDIIIVAQFARRHLISFAVIGEAAWGSFVAQPVTYNLGNWVNDGQPLDTESFNEFVLEQGTMIKITASPSEFFELRGLQLLGVEEYFEISDLVIVVVVNGRVDITIHFDTERINIDYNFSLRRGGDSASLSSTQGNGLDGVTTVSVGDFVTLHLSPQSGFQLSSWNINGLSPSELRSRFDNASWSGNRVTIEVTQEWLNWVNEEGGLDISANTVMNRPFFFGMLAAAVFIPLLLLVIILIALSNAKKKRQHAELLRRRQAGAIMMGQTEALKKLREGGNT